MKDSEMYLLQACIWLVGAISALQIALWGGIALMCLALACAIAAVIRGRDGE